MSNENHMYKEGGIWDRRITSIEREEMPGRGKSQGEGGRINLGRENHEDKEGGDTWDRRITR